tara:strand:+ start:31 stop:1284 length:1254 start_codon:yes stop_codon:yes gene_type:complete
MQLIISRYKKILSENSKLVGFGFAMIFFSSIGQTFFIGLFGPEIQSEFSLSHTNWSSIYMIGTLASAIIMLWTGPMIDRYQLKGFSITVCAFMLVACIFFAFVNGPIALCLGILFLRHSGQALASHTGVTSMGRYFLHDRGSALALASMGQSVAEASLPILTILTIGLIGWRLTYVIAAIIIAVICIPIVIYLLSDHEKTHATHVTSQKTNNQLHNNKLDWTRSQVLRDARFYLLLPGSIATSMIITAFFFHHLNIATYKQWDSSWITGNYILYASTSILATLFAGALIDKFSAQKITLYKLIPLALAALSLGIYDHYLVVIPYMIFLGLNVGFSHTTSSALWAELYGVSHLGSVKSLLMSLSVLSSAIGPVIVGVLLDNGITIETICIYIALYIITSNILFIVAFKIKPQQHLTIT